MKSALFVLWLLTHVTTATPGWAAILYVGQDKPYALPSAAAAAAKSGDHIEIAPGQYIDCAVWL